MNRYESIMNLPHHVSKFHKQMSIYNRAAQFAPFAALDGYSDKIEESNRIVNKKIILDEDEKININNKLNILQNNIKDRPSLIITYFVKDSLKDGGMYNTETKSLRFINKDKQMLVFTDKTTILMDDILDIKY